MNSQVYLYWGYAFIFRLPRLQRMIFEFFWQLCSEFLLFSDCLGCFVSFMPAKKRDNFPQHADIIIEKMINISELSQNLFAKNILGIGGANVSEARKSGKIPVRWFDLMQDKFGISKDELCEIPDDFKKPPEVLIDIARMGESEKNEIMYHQSMDIFFATVKKWWMDKNKTDPPAATLFIREFSSRFPEFDDWVKKRGKDIRSSS